jgi:NAD(P) transhydrogenase subunit beta
MVFLQQNALSVITLSYLIASCLFIIGLKRLSSPATARSGNALGGLGMLLAVLATLLDPSMVSFQAVGVAVALGTIIGLATAWTVEMTQMPQMVAIFNGLGGGASALVAMGEFLRAVNESRVLTIDAQVSVVLGAAIGAVTLTGSFIAFAKLQELMSGQAITFPGQQPLNAALFLAILGSIYLLLENGASVPIFMAMTFVSLVLGVLLVIPIGGADMPVVIALLNSYSGLAASMAGFSLNNNVLIISGALVGASGLILTDIMCRAMNRSIFNVMFGAFGAAGSAGAGSGGDGSDKIHKSTDAEQAAMMLAYAQTVVFVPGYGMAVAQAQHEVRELCEVLEAKGVQVQFAIHPVAGRMPGHMNVLLAEANVPYPKLIEMEDINPEFERTDVAVVIGANDVVNPAARSDSASPIYGMPILDVDKAKTVIMLKRSMRPGFAGIGNELFYLAQTYMLFGDAKESVGALVKEVKAL